MDHVSDCGSTRLDTQAEKTMTKVAMVTDELWFLNVFHGSNHRNTRHKEKIETHSLISGFGCMEIKICYITELWGSIIP